jgi:hypothetical protein
MPGLEPAVAEEWLDTTLNGDATLIGLVPSGAWNTQAKENTTYPLIVYQFMSGIDHVEVASIRIWTNLVYLVKVIGETADLASLNAAVARIDALLHRASGSATDGTVWACVREQTIRLPDSVAGRQYRHSGGLYRIYAT